VGGERRGFPDAAKKEKKDREHSREKIFERSKNVKHSGMWKTKEGGFPCFPNVQEASIERRLSSASNKAATT